MRNATTAPSWLERWLRPGAHSRRHVLIDLLWIVGLGVVMMGAGLGMRDPWPADEPRFALVAQDMLRSGDWLIPRVGGDLYADKPPLYFWTMALAIALTGSLRIGFLLPSLLAGVGVLVLVYDLVRRVSGREAALASALLLLVTFQFVWQTRQAQIDATLCFLTTLSLYGLLRHLVAGPSLGWFYAGWAAAGLGVVTKGIGFLPLLALVPYAVLRARGWPATAPAHDARLWLGPAFFLAAIASWFVPMMLATAADGELLAYRNEILFQQTLDRYANAWHHREPPWYYLTNVVPLLWLPAIVLLPWLWPRWRAALRGDPSTATTFVATLLAWVVLVLVFFSASAGKRGVYVLPALPALVMAAGPWLPELLRKPALRGIALALAAVFAALLASGAIYFALSPEATLGILERYGIAPPLPLALGATAALAGVAFFRLRDGWLAYGMTLAAILVVTGVVVNPGMDAERSGRALMVQVANAARDLPELGLVAAKEQYLLQLDRPTVNFGHARWREWEQEAADAAAWFAAGPGRALLVDDKALEACFKGAQSMRVASANRKTWYLVTGGTADPACIARGDPRRARPYVPRIASTNSVG